ncbi:MAG: hypothetical protein AB199_01045 [Parcubacteria bacterium C7867-004]|nr:MAG: hypothetical protein AB199_01045 [Parcubacteria bacterium C7867-004]
MDCANCGVCCTGWRVRLNALEQMTTAEQFKDGQFLKMVGNRCIFLDPQTMRCTNYDQRPDTCKRFTLGGDACRSRRREAGMETEQEAA